MVGFQGKPITRTKEEFENLVNQKDYIGLPGDTVQGSVRDYFYDMSYERMEFEVEVFGPYMMPQAASAYSGEGQTHPLARALIDSIRADGANFADYDADNNGIIDGLHLIYAGYERTPIGRHQCGNDFRTKSKRQGGQTYGCSTNEIGSSRRLACNV